MNWGFERKCALERMKANCDRKMRVIIMTNYLLIRIYYYIYIYIIYTTFTLLGAYFGFGH